MTSNRLPRAGAPVLVMSLLAALLSACGGNHDDAPAPLVKVTELSAGAYAVSAGDAADPTAGKYYAAADGSRLLVLNNGSQRASGAMASALAGIALLWNRSSAVSALASGERSQAPLASRR